MNEIPNFIPNMNMMNIPNPSYNYNKIFELEQRIIKLENNYQKLLNKLNENNYKTNNQPLTSKSNIDINDDELYIM